MKLTGSRGLSFVVAVWTAVAIAYAMAVYAVFQYFTIPDVTVWELFRARAAFESVATAGL